MAQGRRSGGGGGGGEGQAPPFFWATIKKKEDYRFTVENTELITQRVSPFDFKKCVRNNFLTSQERLNPWNAKRHIYGEQSDKHRN